MRARWALPVVLGVVALAPLAVTPYWLRVLTSIAMYVVLAQGLNIISGYTGYPAFGNIVFFGIGAYATAILQRDLGLPLLPSVVTGAAMAGVLAIVLGPPILRLKGNYFAIATLGVNEACRELVALLGGLTGGGKGISLPMLPGTVTEVYAYYYYLMLGGAVAAVIAVWGLARSRFGYGCMAIKDNEDAAAVMGVPTTLYKTLAWAVSASFTGYAGGVHASWMSYVAPADAFDMLVGVKAWIMLLLGGAGSVLGPVFGVVIIEVISQVIWSRVLWIHAALLGIIMAAVVILIPQGLAGLRRRPLTPAGLLAHLRESRV